MEGGSWASASHALIKRDYWQSLELTLCEIQSVYSIRNEPASKLLKNRKSICRKFLVKDCNKFTSMLSFWTSFNFRENECAELYCCVAHNQTMAPYITWHLYIRHNSTHFATLVRTLNPQIQIYHNYNVLLHSVQCSTLYLLN